MNRRGVSVYLGLVVVLGSCRLSLAGETESQLLPYDPALTFRYAAKYCKEGNDCPSGEYLHAFPKSTDCAHFVCHCLAAGGVRVPGTEVSCASRLCIRVEELRPWLQMVCKTYVNVKKIDSWKETLRGDICFEARNGEFFHVMILADKAKANGAKVYGHMNNRCGDRLVEFDVPVCEFYRLDAYHPSLPTTADVRFRIAEPNGLTLEKEVEEYLIAVYAAAGAQSLNDNKFADFRVLTYYRLHLRPEQWKQARGAIDQILLTERKLMTGVGGSRALVEMLKNERALLADGNGLEDLRKDP